MLVFVLDRDFLGIFLKNLCCYLFALLPLVARLTKITEIRLLPDLANDTIPQTIWQGYSKIKRVLIPIKKKKKSEQIIAGKQYIKISVLEIFQKLESRLGRDEKLFSYSFSKIIII